jgi:hypothetical protein
LITDQGHTFKDDCDSQFTSGFQQRTMATVHQDAWTPAVCGSFYLHPSNNFESSESTLKDSSIKLNVNWDEIDHKFLITCDHFSSKTYTTNLG